MRQQLQDVVIAYDAAGRGSPLLLLHGFPLSRKLWQPQLDGLTDIGRVIAPDLRGHGETGPVPGEATMEVMADDMAALLDALKVKGRVVVGGLSMGGYVAQHFAHRYPERLAGLILAATRAGADSAEGQVARDRMADQARQKGAEAVVEAMLPRLLSPRTLDERPDVLDEARAIAGDITVEGMVAALMAMKERPDATAWLAELAVPVLILHGADDLLIPPSEAEATQALVPGARLQIIPGAGHLVNLEQPAAFNAEVRNFLQGL
jgi:pimeloyl-ACP methyl ester carboxylesterase